MEEWKDIVGYKKFYSVSNLGKIKRKTGNILSDIVTQSGYCNVSLCKNSKVYSCRIHRLVAEHFIGIRPKGFTINHKDGNKLNNSLENLEYLSIKDNINHAWKTNLCKNKGIEHSWSKLIEKEILEIRKAYIPHKITYKYLANIYNTTPTNIFSIIKRHSWKHI